MFPNLVIIQTPHRLRHKFIPSTSLRMDWMLLSLWIFSIMLSSVQTQEDKKDEAWSYVNFLRNEVRYYIKLMDIMNVGRLILQNQGSIFNNILKSLNKHLNYGPQRSETICLRIFSLEPFLFKKSTSDG